MTKLDTCSRKRVRLPFVPFRNFRGSWTIRFPWLSFFEGYNGGYRIYGPIMVVFQRHYNPGHIWTPLVWCWARLARPDDYARREHYKKMQALSAREMSDEA